MEHGSLMYSASIADLENITQWLRGSDDLQWEDQTALLAQTISDLEDMAQPKTRRDKTGSRSAESDLLTPEATAINAAMLDLIEMSMAMELGNRKDAIESGEAALALLPKRT
jgi:hypothetical protein